MKTEHLAAFQSYFSDVLALDKDLEYKYDSSDLKTAEVIESTAVICFERGFTMRETIGRIKSIVEIIERD